MDMHVQTYQGYKAISVGDGLDYTAQVSCGGAYLGSLSWGWSEGFLFDLKKAVEEGWLMKMLNITSSNNII